ncbi:PEP/pyruvate-binding domain-containing protein [Chitinivorax sp. B]|uniref:PEP/pyruvate-binding domain-containing protein n=1 Tax=Chitinivorax sp. B TaxID=2502235 RepID=UPI0010F9D757|nr:PEP/pyruvate-binding domain-containing protein [Chitinivorax sp. B]
MTWVIDWSAAFEAGAGVVGGKGWNLSRLARYGFQVPAGGVVVAEAYAQFVIQNQLTDKLAAAEQAGAQASATLLADIRQSFLSLPIPVAIEQAIRAFLQQQGLTALPCAVRSSAIAEDSSQASFAGVHHSSLNVLGVTAVIMAIRECWASAWTARAISYRQHMAVAADQAKPAAVIMAMVPAVAAGVAFTCDPRSGREDLVYISANFGLGESVVGGAASPDEFVVDTQRRGPDWHIAERHIGRKEQQTCLIADGGTELVRTDAIDASRPCLPDNAIMRLAQFAIRIFDALGDGEQHQDIEWVYDGTQLHFVQARPVTTRSFCHADAIADQPVFWSNGNYRDVLPMAQSMLTWTSSLYPVSVILHASYHRVRYPVQPGVSWARRYRGRGYFNLSLMQWALHDCFGLSPALINRTIGGHQPEIDVPGKSSWPDRLRRLLRNVRLGAKLTHIRPRGSQYIQRVEQEVARHLHHPWHDEPDSTLIKTLNDLGRFFTRQPELHLMLSAGMGTHMALAWLLNRFLAAQGERLAQALVIDSEGITSAEHGQRLAQLADLASGEPDAIALLQTAEHDPFCWRKLPEASTFRQTMDAFLHDFGHRGIYELDLQRPRWREDPSWLLVTLRSMIGRDEHKQLAIRRRQTRDDAWADIRQHVPRWLHPTIRTMARNAAVEAAQREAAKSAIVRISGLSRLIALEIGRRLQRRGLLLQVEDVFHCSSEDLAQLMTGIWQGQGLITLIADRHERQRQQNAQVAPDLLELDSPRPVQARIQQGENDTVYHGLAVAAGRATGTVRLINSPDDGAQLQHGDVLVAPSTDPAWTPLFLRASALITETGGMVSHGAIVAREYGIPAVVNIPGIMQLLKNGTQVEVDGDRGLVICPHAQSS